jgi:hypothetical protein
MVARRYGGECLGTDLTFNPAHDIELDGRVRTRREPEPAHSRTASSLNSRSASRERGGRSDIQVSFILATVDAGTPAKLLLSR